MKTALLLLTLTGCAAVPLESIRVATHELALPDLVSMCSKGARDYEPDLLGCYEWQGTVCHIYTLPRWVREMREGGISEHHRTLGHELDHCFRGPFHGRDKGVPLPRLPRLVG